MTAEPDQTADFNDEKCLKQLNRLSYRLRRLVVVTEEHTPIALGDPSDCWGGEVSTFPRVVLKTGDCQL